MNAAAEHAADLLSDRIQSVRDDIVPGAAVTFAFRARRRLVLSERIILTSWVLLGAFVLPSALFAFTSVGVVPVVILSPVFAQLFTAIVGRGSSRALATAADGTVIVARLAWIGLRVRGIEKIYDPARVVIEPSTPGWRTQCVMINDDVWFHCNRATHFVRRTEQTSVGVHL